MPRFSIHQEYPFLFPAGAVASWLLLSWHSAAFAKALQHLHNSSPCSAPAHHLPVWVGQKRKLGTGAMHTFFSHPHVGSKPSLLGTAPAPPEPTCSPPVLVKRCFPPPPNQGTCYTNHLPWLQFFTSSPWAEDHRCNRGRSSSYSFCMQSCLPFMLCLTQT